MTDVLKAALKESVGTNDFDRLNYLKQQFFKSRQVGVCEAAYRLIPGLHMTYSNVKVIFLATGFPENRTVYFKRISGDDDKELHNENALGNDDLPPDEIVDTEPVDKGNQSNIVKISGRDGTYEITISAHDKYGQRPAELDNICFAQFAMAYESVKGIPKKEIGLMDGFVHTGRGKILRFDTDEGLPKFIRLTNGSYMKLRGKPYVLRLHASHRKQGYEELYAELQLYYPWRNEVEDLA